MKCCPCTDQMIIDGHADEDTLPDAITMAPVVQSIPIGGQQLTGFVTMPVCFRCRQEMMGKVSKTGLVTS